jgi:predicted nucleic acid-binding Zn ribbon protein
MSNHDYCIICGEDISDSGRQVCIACEKYYGHLNRNKKKNKHEFDRLEDKTRYKRGSRKK